MRINQLQKIAEAKFSRRLKIVIEKEKGELEYEQ